MGARGWRDAGDCSSDDGAGGDDGFTKQSVFVVT